MAILQGFGDSNMLLLAVHGYHPFTPEIGAICGGYQGILYPTPTTMASCGGTYIDPRLYVSPFPSPYIPASTRDLYPGLGVGNPGVNYYNPGHLLGLLDTIHRMSYGLRVCKAIYDGSNVENTLDRSISCDVPFKSQDGTVYVDPIAFTENPTKYISHFTALGNQYLLKDPRSIQCAIEGDGGYIVSHWDKSVYDLETSPFYHDSTQAYEVGSIIPITFIGLFDQIYTYSYFGIPEFIQSLMSQMYEYAGSFVSQHDHQLLSASILASSFPVSQDEWSSWQAENAPFPMRPPQSFDEWGASIHPISTPWPESDHLQPIIPDKVSINSVGLIMSEDEEEEPVYYDVPGVIRTNFTRLTPLAALKLLTGSPEFHAFDSTRNVYEYRSIPELNAITNILPARAVGMRYMVRLHRDSLWDNPWEGFNDTPTGQVPKVAGTVPQIYYPSDNMPTMFCITDVCFNITVATATTIRIQATGTLDRADRLDPINIPGWELPEGQEPQPNDGKQLWTYDFIGRQSCLLVSATNEFTWDRAWHGLPLHNNTYSSISEKVICADPYPGVSPDSQFGDTIDWEESTTMLHEISVELQPGCNNVRARFIVQNLNMLKTLVLTENITDDQPLFCDDLYSWVRVIPPSPDEGDEAIFDEIVHYFEFTDPQTHRPEEASDDDDGGTPEE